MAACLTLSVRVNLHGSTTVPPAFWLGEPSKPALQQQVQLLKRDIRHLSSNAEEDETLQPFELQNMAKLLDA